MLTPDLICGLVFKKLLQTHRPPPLEFSPMARVSLKLPAVENGLGKPNLKKVGLLQRMTK